MRATMLTGAGGSQSDFVWPRMEPWLHVVLQVGIGPRDAIVPNGRGQPRKLLKLLWRG